MQGTSMVIQSAWVKGGLIMVALTLTACGGGGSSSGGSNPIKIDRVTPNTAVVNVPSEFTIEGDATVLAQANLSVSLSNCKGVKINSKSSGKLTFGCTPEQAGNQTLQLKNAQGGMLYQTQIAFALKPYIEAMTPTQVEVNLPATFVLTGINLGLGLKLPTLQGCNNIEQLSSTSTQYTFRCTPTLEGNQTLVVQSAAGETIYTKPITVRPKVLINQVVYSTDTVNVGQLTTFTLKGSNFITQADVEMASCNSELLVHSRSLTEIKFSCIPEDIGVKQIQLKDTSGYVYAAVPVNVQPFLTRKSRWYATGINTCGNETQNGLVCSAAALGELFGLQQDGEGKIGVLTEFKLVTKEDALNIPDENKCIKDVYTGLIWEQKTDDGGVRDQDWTYTWYEPNGNINGSGEGDAQNPKPIPSGSLGTTATCAGIVDGSVTPKALPCNMQNYIKYLNQIKYCGYTTWRMPHIGELETLVNLSRLDPNPAIHNKAFFAKTARNTYWSMVPASDPLSHAWGIDFAVGMTGVYAKDQAYAIRAVTQ